jgi:pimeloyl-ACP methyl ester carboxylesterase
MWRSPRNDVQSLQQHGVELLTMPAVGHFLMMEDPQSFNDLLRQVLCARLSLPK